MTVAVDKQLLFPKKGPTNPCLWTEKEETIQNNLSKPVRNFERTRGLGLELNLLKKKAVRENKNTFPTKPYQKVAQFIPLKK